ncbi:iron complex outermembrane receptor protein [Inhella inkyongensis]|uniref:Iron complex outermembrane receptor protein n=1 Tax=Inhella inkyongensis TaxID=392593 RepID=A0A840S2V9_9BURK|nr:TonB-dependent receptor [Inhella inkyongensis]MBB5202920.1 iron complex outermembrane receptor protein [Inhella inkyongensis]
MTGSSIKRIQKEGATPIQVVSRADIEKAGVANIGELLNALPGMAGAEDGTFSLQPTLSGSQGAAVHGFANGDTLVLLNGKRLPRYPVGGDFVDVNSVPLAIVERVEVLRDGASALYGSDAVAGVVNLITKRDFKGLTMSATMGKSSRNDGDKQKLSFSAGTGDMGSDGYNVAFGVEVDSTDGIFNRDRPLTASADLRPYGLGDDRLPTSPEPNVYLWDQDLYRPISPCKAPLPADGVAVESASPGKVCAFDPNSTTMLQPNLKSRAYFVAGSVQLPADMTLRLEAFDKFKESGNFLNPQPITNNVSASDPANPYKEDLTWFFRSTDPRLFRQKNIEVGARRFMATLDGTFDKYDWSVTAGQGKSNYREEGSGYFINSLFTAAVRNGVINPFTGKLNPNDLVPLTAAPVRTAFTKADFLDAKLSGSLFSMAGGDAMFAVGLGHYKEAYSNYPDALQRDGLLRGDPKLAIVDGKSRTVKHVFTEGIFPVLKNLELGLAVRHDKYSDVGGTTNPKASVRFEAMPELVLRASVGTGFRAPTLEDLYASDVTGFPQAIDYAGCAAAGTPRANCRAKQIFTNTKSNPNLKPEETKSMTFGLAFSPVKDLLATLDYINLEKEDAIAALDIQTILDNPNLPVAGYGTAKDLVRRLPNGQLVPDSTVPVIIAPTANVAAIKTQLVDFGLRYDLKFSGVKIRLENNHTRLLKRDREPAPGLGLSDYAGLAGFAKYRNVFSASAEMGAFSAGAYLRSIDGFLDVDTPSAVDPTTPKIKAWHTLDLVFGYKGILGKKGSVDLLIKNATDKMPPLSTALNTSNKIDFNHSAVGRYYQVTTKWEF